MFTDFFWMQNTIFCLELMPQTKYIHYNNKKLVFKTRSVEWADIFHLTYTIK